MTFALQEEPRGLDAELVQALPTFAYRRRLPQAHGSDDDAASSQPGEPAAPSAGSSADAAAAASASTGSAEHVHDQCSICLCEYEDGDVLKTLPCFHKFHASCVDPWLATRDICPTCRHRITGDMFREDAGINDTLHQG